MKKFILFQPDLCLEEGMRLKMIDFHSHILPGIDDGSIDFENSIKIIEEAKQAGFTKIVSTSHYIEEYYEVNAEKRKMLLNELQKKVQGVELYLGSEIYITETMLELIKENKASTINKSHYVLFELPLNAKAMNVKEIVYRLIENNYIPIIAHPERYTYVQEETKLVEELAEMGALFQANFGSIIGLYGKRAKNTVKKLFKLDLISFLGSDVHRVGQIYPKIDKAMKKIKKIISEERLEEITKINPQKVLNNDHQRGRFFLGIGSSNRYVKRGRSTSPAFMYA